MNAVLSPQMAAAVLLLSALRTLLVRHSCYPLLVCCLAAWLSFPLSVFAQGPLNPPGAPTPSMKSLDQIQPRTPISSAPFTISVAGSYYLTQDLGVSSGHAITIASSGVTLDLNGFTISSTDSQASYNGILINTGLRDITISNGHIEGGVTNSGGNYSGSGFFNGISFSGSAPAAARISQVSVSGCRNDGINVYSASASYKSWALVESCSVRTVGGNGIAATLVRNSLAVDCGGTGISGSGVVTNCWAQAGPNFDGISANFVENSYGESTNYGSGTTGNGVNVAGMALNSRGSSVGAGNGISASSAQNCIGQSNTGNGIYAFYTAENCFGQAVGNAGIQALTILNCNATISSPGIYVVQGGSASNCVANGNYGDGIYADSYSIVTNCSAYNNPSGNGIELAGYNRAIGNLCINNGRSGIYSSGSYNHIEANTVIGNNPSATGLRGGIAVINGTHNIIIRNTGSNNGVANFNLTSIGNAYGDFVNVYSSSSGTDITTSNPWANFGY